MSAKNKVKKSELEKSATKALKEAATDARKIAKAYGTKLVVAEAKIRKTGLSG
jgi:hypothetical protein